MKLITSVELSKRTETELRGLFAMVSKDLIQTKRDTWERRNALASLENINRVLNGMRARPRAVKPGF